MTYEKAEMEIINFQGDEFTAFYSHDEPGQGGNPTKAEKEKALKRKERKRYYGQTAYIYPRRPWSEEEVEMVMAHTMPDSELSQKICRSVKTIQQKRLLVRKELNQRAV